MPRPSSRLDLYVVADEPLFIPSPDQVAVLNRTMERCGAATFAVGARTWRFDQPGHAVLYANGQGGFRVHCPRCEANIARCFAHAVERWRAGGPRTLICVECEQSSDLSDVNGRPGFAIASFALVLIDVSRGELLEGAQTRLGVLFGSPVHTIGRRVSH